MEPSNPKQPQECQRDQDPLSTVRETDAAADDDLLRKLLQKLDQHRPRESALPKLVRPTAMLKGVRLLGRGGLGCVHRYHDAVLNRDLALKVARQHIMSSSTGIERFVRERRITAKLNHPSIPPVHHSGTLKDGRPYYVMRLIRGRSLSQLLKQRKALPSDYRRDPRLSRLLDAFERICDAVQYAHEAGIIHRDIKPANIVLEKHGAAYLVDWGLARERLVRETEMIDGEGGAASPTDESTEPAPDSPHLTQMAHRIGSPDYMSPEQAEGRIAAHGPATDVYGLGATLYHLLTGIAPHAATRPAHAESSDQIYARIAGASPPSADSLVPQLPAALASICRKAMLREPADRYRSARELQHDLQRWRKDEVVQAHATRYTLLQRVQLFTSRHQRLVSIVAAGTLLVLLVSLFAAALVTEKNLRLDAANTELYAAKGDLDEKIEQLNTASAELTTTNQVLDQKVRDLREVNERLTAERDRLELSLQIGFKMLRGIETDRFRSLDDAYVDILQNGLQMPDEERAAMLPLYQALISMQKAEELVTSSAQDGGVSGLISGVTNKLSARSEIFAALDALDASILKSDKMGLAWLLRAQIRSEFLSHPPKDVLHDWECAVNLLPRCSAALSGRGWCRLRMSDIELAEADFNQAIELDRLNEYARFGLGKIRVNQKNYDDALEHLKNALEQAPRYSMNLDWKVNLYEPLSYAHWGLAAQMLKNEAGYAEGLEHLCSALAFSNQEDRPKLWENLILTMRLVEPDKTLPDHIRKITPARPADASSKAFAATREFVAILAEARADAIFPAAVESLAEQLRKSPPGIDREISLKFVQHADELLDAPDTSSDARDIVAPLLLLLRQHAT